jgi:hypothetical protein
MAISNTSILIKRSQSTGKPASLNQGELGYSYLSNTLFFGTVGGNGVVNVGGQYYTSTVDAATQSNTASTLVKRDPNGAFFGRLYGDANTADTLTNSQNFSVSGGDITASAVGFNGSSGVTLNASLTNVVPGGAGSVGSATSVPVIQYGANGRILSVSSASIQTSFSVSDGTHSNTVNGGSTLTFGGNNGITATVNPSTETVTLSTDNTVVRSNTSAVGTQTIGTDVQISGNLTVTGAVTYVNTSIVQSTGSLLHLAANNTVGDVLDIGFVGEYNNGSTSVAAGLVRDAGNKGFYLFQNVNASAVTGNTVANNLFTSSNTATLYANIIAPQINTSSANITTATIGTLALTNALPVTSGGTGTTTSTGTGSVVLSNSPTFTGQITAATMNVSQLNVSTINVTTTYINSVVANTVNIGTLSYAASGAFASFAANTNSYQQVVIQNQNLGNQASADFVVSNDYSTDGFLYGDFGINGPNYSNGSGALNGANTVYMYASNTELAIGTSSVNGIHFVVNNGATDAMNISSSGVVTLGTALGVGSGGTGVNTFSSGQILIGAGTNSLQQLANVAPINTTITSNSTISNLTTDVYGRVTGYTTQAISGLTVGQGGTGQSTFTTNGITYGNGSGALQVTAAAGSADQTFSNQILTVTNSGIPTWSTTMDGGSF